MSRLKARSWVFLVISLDRERMGGSSTLESLMIENQLPTAKKREHFSRQQAVAPWGRVSLEIVIRKIIFVENSVTGN